KGAFHHTPQQNGIVERKHRRLLNVARGVKKAYKLYSLENKGVFFSRDVTFYEIIFPIKLKNESVNCKNVRHEHEFELNLLNFFDNTNGHASKTPYDDKRDYSNGDGNVMAPDNINSSHPVDEDATFATPLNENVNIYKGQQQSDASISRFFTKGQNSSNIGDEPQTMRKSGRV
ncbi:hypothetical protein Tco_0074329, partial [Tanacetum coccineum]